MKYNIDPELKMVSKIKMPNYPKLLPIINAVCRGFLCRTDKKAVVKRYRMPGYLGAPLLVHVIEPKQTTKQQKSLPCLVLFHGGGFMLRASGIHYKIAKEYAVRMQCKVIHADYRLAPKYPFPIPAEDCFAAYQWTLSHAKQLGIDKENVFLGGDSAGGDLAAATVFMARDRNCPLPKGVLLVYPVLDRRMQTMSMRTFTDTPVWDAKLNRTMWQCYIGKETPAPVEYASPAEATDVSCFPPTYLEVAEFDCLHDEGAEFGKRLEKSGVAVELHEIKGGCHGYETAINSLVMKTCLDMRIAWMKKLVNKIKKTEKVNVGFLPRVQKVQSIRSTSDTDKSYSGFKRNETVSFNKARIQWKTAGYGWNDKTWRKS